MLENLLNELGLRQRAFKFLLSAFDYCIDDDFSISEMTPERQKI